MGEFFHALTYGVYIVTTVHDGKKYGMACSWGTQVDMNKIMMILGDQSKTAKAIQQSKKFGVSVLGKDMKEIALKFGNSHSDVSDKFEGLDYYECKMGVPLFKNAIKTLECELVEDVEKGRYVGEIKHHETIDNDKERLLLSDIDS